MAFDPSHPAQFPAFKKKNRAEAGLRYPDARQIKLDLAARDPEGRTVSPNVFAPKVGRVKFRQSRPMEGSIKNATA